MGSALLTRLRSVTAKSRGVALFVPVLTRAIAPICTQHVGIASATLTTSDVPDSVIFVYSGDEMFRASEYEIDILFSVLDE